MLRNPVNVGKRRQALSEFQIREVLGLRLYGEAMARGPEAEIPLLNELLQRATEEGTPEDIWYVLWHLVDAHVRGGHVAEAVSIAERLMHEPGANAQICTAVASTLYRHLGVPAVALSLVQKCRADLQSAGTLWEYEFYAGALIGLELALLAHEDPYSERIRMAAGDIQWHSVNKPAMNDDLLEAFRILVPMGVLNRIHKPILEIMWAQLQRRMKFDRMTKAHQRDLQAKIEEVERLIDALQVRRSPPKPPKHFNKEKSRVEEGSNASSDRKASDKPHTI
jgi:hypothetical protein